MDREAYGAFAHHYDPAYEAKALGDVGFYVDVAREADGPVLEIACGTGRVLLEIARAGIEITGIDFCVPYLDILSVKLSREPEDVRSRVTLHEADMRSFDLDATFDRILIPFRPMQHMCTKTDQLAALSRAREHLSGNGRLVFDVFFPNLTMLENESANGREIEELSWVDPSNSAHTVKRFFCRRRVDLVRQVFEADFVFRTYEGTTVVREERSELVMGWYTYAQLELLADAAGLRIEAAYGSFERAPLGEGNEMILVLSRA